MREAGGAALAMTGAGDAAPALTGAGGAPHPLLAVAAPHPLTGTLHLTISRCLPATMYMHLSETASVIALGICIERTVYTPSL